MNIASSLTQRARLSPKQTAIIKTRGIDKKGPFQEFHLKYEELEHRSEALAKGFLAQGFKTQNLAAVMIEPSFELFITTFALFKAGIVPVFIDPGIGIANLKKCLAQAKPDYFIGIAKAQLARALLGWNRGQWKRIVTMSQGRFGSDALDELEAKGRQQSQVELPSAEPEDRAAILFTSGSTGIPKGAVYSHKNFWAQIHLLKDAFAIEPGEVDLCTFPLFGLFAPALGMTAVIPEMNFTKPALVHPPSIFRAVKTFGVHNMFGSPALLKRISEAGIESDIVLPSLKRVISAGAPVPTETLRKMKQILGESSHVFTPYGATEALPVAIASSQEILARTSKQTLEGAGVCVGYPVAGLDVKIIKVSDHPLRELAASHKLGPMDIGEIVVSGDQVTESYLNHPSATHLAKTLCEGQLYHRMGDLGYFDSQGRLWFCGRKSHRIVTAKDVVYTVPGESILNQHQDVLRTAIVGVGQKERRRPVLCVETLRPIPAKKKQRLKDELLAMGKNYQQTRLINEVLFHRGFPVDIRHNSKIFREKLAKWAERKMP